MTKKELVDSIPSALALGAYVAPRILFDLYKDDEDVPESVARTLIRDFEPTRPIEMYYGLGEKEKIDSLFSEFIKKD